MRGSGVKGMVCIQKVRAPNLSYKIRQLTYGNRTGDAFGITVPHETASLFKGFELMLVVSGNCFMYVKSGVKI